MKHEWYEKDGHIFSTEVKSKHSQEFRLGKEYEYQNSIAFNVGSKIAKHIVELHNASLNKVWTAIHAKKPGLKDYGSLYSGKNYWGTSLVVKRGTPNALMEVRFLRASPMVYSYIDIIDGCLPSEEGLIPS